MIGEFLKQAAGHAPALSLAFALLLFAAEGWRQRTPLRYVAARRWAANGSLVVVAWVLLAWLAPLTIVAATLFAAERGLGLFNLLHVPTAVAVVASILVVDLADYALHRLEHRLPSLWRIHRLHHTDPDVDVTTTYRFHPLEIVLRSVASSAVAVLVGMPPLAAAAYVVLTTLSSVLSHANIRLPDGVDRALRQVVITPDFHRTHHSRHARDANANFGVCLAFWDRLFGTYVPMPARGHEGVEFGVEGYSHREATAIVRMLADPFLRGPGNAAPAGDATPVPGEPGISAMERKVRSMAAGTPAAHPGVAVQGEALPDDLHLPERDQALPSDRARRMNACQTAFGSQMSR